MSMTLRIHTLVKFGRPLRKGPIWIEIAKGVERELKRKAGEFSLLRHVRRDENQVRMTAKNSYFGINIQKEAHFNFGSKDPASESLTDANNGLNYALAYLASRSDTIPKHSEGELFTRRESDKPKILMSMLVSPSELTRLSNSAKVKFKPFAVSLTAKLGDRDFLVSMVERRRRYYLYATLHADFEGAPPLGYMTEFNNDFGRMLGKVIAYLQSG